MAQVKHALGKRRALARGGDKKKRARNRFESTKALPLLLFAESDKEDEGSDGESLGENEGDADADEGDVVTAWLRARDDAEDDNSADDEDISRNNDSDLPETQASDTQPLPEENDPKYPQEKF
jgi:hypothetical protein